MQKEPTPYFGKGEDERQGKDWELGKRTGLAKRGTKLVSDPTVTTSGKGGEWKGKKKRMGFRQVDSYLERSKLIKKEKVPKKVAKVVKG